MPNRKFFSIVEVMTVILIMLLLMSLMIPIFTNLKMNARTAICNGQLRQIGSLITSYVSENNGYLPSKWANGAYSEDNGLRGDIPRPLRAAYSKGPSNELYRYWNGHLLPYLDVHLPHRFTRYAMVTKAGCTRSDDSQLGGPANSAPKNPLDYGWVVIDDAFRKGGYNDLRVFICPEIHQNTFDVDAALVYNNVRIPRITQLCNHGFGDRAGYEYSMNGGTPTTYLANKNFFDAPTANSCRIDQINDISHKAYLLEGGLANPFGTGSNGEIAPPYFNVGTLENDGGDLSFYVLQAGPSSHKLSFVHDDYDKFWIMPALVGYGGYFPNMWWSRIKRIEVAEKFNQQFAPKAYMIEGTQTSNSFDGSGIVSFVNPTEYAPIFTSFFNKNFPGTIPLNPFIPFVDEPNDFKYMTGDTNVLYGDGSASKRGQAWLYNNRKKVAF